jgi:(R)-amidase
MGSLRVAAVQLVLYLVGHKSDRKSDHKKAVREAERAAIRSAKKGARLIVLPEHWLADEVLERDNDVVRRFSKLARKMDVYVNLGAYYERIGNRTFLTSVMLAPTGRDYFRQDKVHLYRSEGKAATGGSGFGTCLVDGFRVGVLVCHDMVFPEAARASAVAGAELFVVPSLIVKAGALPWVYYLRARALENRVRWCLPTSTSRQWSSGEAES